MSIVYNNTLKTARMNAVRAAIDAGSPTAGYIEIGTSGMGTVLATITFDDPCGSVGTVGTVVTLTFAGTPLSDASAAASGTAVSAEVFDSAGTVIISGLTVGTSSTTPVPDVILNSTAIVADEPVTMSAASIIHG